MQSSRNVWFLDHTSAGNGLSLRGCREGCHFLLSLGIVGLSGSPVMRVTLWFIASSIIKTFSRFTTFVERISAIEEGLVFNNISPTI